MKLCKLGDVNGDGTCDSADVALMQKKLGGWNVSYVYDETADIDLSGKSDSSDLSVLQKYLAGWKVAFGK